MQQKFLLVLAVISCCAAPACLTAQSASNRPTTILVPIEASRSEILAAHEVRRYAWLRTGKLLPISIGENELLPRKDAIVIARKDRALARAAAAGSTFATILDSLPAQCYCIKTIPTPRANITLLTGGDDAGTLYAAYRFAEILGVRFYLHGDVVPEEKMSWHLPALDEQHTPLFALRGIQPFHDFPEGPDWWNLDDYLAIVGQLPKLRMNFIGLHTYPEGGPNAEPTVWIGRPKDILQDGLVAFSYPASYQNTARGNWGYLPKKTSDYIYGASGLFDGDDYGAEVMRDDMPEPATPDRCNALFDRVADMLRSVFEEAHRLHVKTCVGTETPLTIPNAVQARLQSEGKDPAQRAVLEELYEGIFRRIQAAYPLDFYWFWTPEGWTWEGTKWDQVARTTNDLSAALAAYKEVQPSFTLATCGWVLGPQQDRALFDKVLPKNVTISCINREVGKTPVDKGFAEVQGRGKWAIPWLEDDGGLTAPELWAGRMRRDALDARRYGCDGLMGIHWRTRVLGPAVSSLAQAAWTQDKPGDLTAFYRDWAQAEFGADTAAAAGALFARLDGKLPRPVEWVDGPGGLKPDKHSWNQVSRAYAFVDEFAALEKSVRGSANRERFEYWLNTFRCMRATAELRCAWGSYNAVVDPLKTEKDPARKQLIGRSSALPLRRQMVQLTGQLYGWLLATVSNPGEMGTVMNWESHILPGLLTKPGEDLAALLGEPLPSDAQPSHAYRGLTRLIVPTIRTSLRHGEHFKVKAIILAEHPVRNLVLCSRPLGHGTFSEVPFIHVNRGVYAVTVPARSTTDDFEYYAKAEDSAGKPVFFPAGAPGRNQTVVVIPD